jgi:hypothetical protein
MQLCYVNAQQLRQLEDCSSFWLTWQQQVSISKCRAVFPKCRAVFPVFFQPWEQISKI